MAKKVIDKYSNLFTDVDDDGVVLGAGTHTQVNKLQDRNNYLNRPHKRKEPSSTSPTSSKKRFGSARADSINWSPEITDNIAECPKNIQNHDEDFYVIMEKTHPVQRQFSSRVDQPTAMEIKEVSYYIFGKGNFLSFLKTYQLCGSNFQRLINISLTMTYPLDLLSPDQQRR